MNAFELLERTLTPNGVAMAPDESEFTLNIASIYQNDVTRDWATQSFHQATRLATIGD